MGRHIADTNERDVEALVHNVTTKKEKQNKRVTHIGGVCKKGKVEQRARERMGVCKLRHAVRNEQKIQHRPRCRPAIFVNLAKI
jgi:hypothetical protein